MFYIEEELKKLPKSPGVYLMKDKNDTVIYVGKAVILKNRVKQYFRKNNKTKKKMLLPGKGLPHQCQCRAQTAVFLEILQD